MEFILSPESKTMLETLSNPNSAGVFLKEGLFGADMLIYSVMLREAINQSMIAAFPKQWKHFKVDNTGSNQYGSMVSVRAADDVGKYLWYGTLPHYITALPGYALEFPDQSGNIIYREEVFVAGIAPMKDKMTAVVDEAALKVSLLIGK